MLLIATDCYLRRAGQICLALKQMKIGAGRYNGYGGKIDEKEKIRDAAARELLEESGVRASSERLQRVGDITFHQASVPEWRVHFFMVWDWKDEPRAVEPEKMGPPEWFDINHLPFSKLMPADVHYLPRLLAGECLRGKIFYNADATVLEGYELETVTSEQLES